MKKIKPHKVKNARKKVTKSKINAQAPSFKELNILVKYYDNGRFEDAEKLAKRITKAFPNHKLGWNVLGLLMGQSGRMEKALIATQNTLRLDPNDVDACTNLGIIFMELGRLEEAEETLRKAIVLQPNAVSAYVNLGNVLKELGRLDEAEASLNHALVLEPNHVLAHNNLGNTLKELGRLDEAESSLRQALVLEPGYANAYNGLGDIFEKLNRLEEAEVNYRQSITLDSTFVICHVNLGHLLKKLGRLQEAESCYRLAINIKPDCGEAIHMLATLTGETTSSAPRNYVEALFDGYAEDFENSLIDQLEYKIPLLIADMILKNHSDDLLGKVLDLGCGTGLVGKEVKQFCSHLVGIDLSNSMLEHARRKDVYDELMQSDILEYLSTEDLNFDYFISADVFVYMGDLSEVFRLIKSRNRSGGTLMFSTEHNSKDGFFLEPSGRYSHSKEYIDSLCKEFDYRLTDFDICDLRKDNNRVILGGIYRLDF